MRLSSRSVFILGVLVAVTIAATCTPDWALPWTRQHEQEAVVVVTPTEPTSLPTATMVTTPVPTRDIENDC